MLRKLEHQRSNAGPVEELLDVNVLAKDLKHCDVRSFVMSPDHTVAAFALDASGDEVYEIRVLDLKSNTFVEDESLPKQAVGTVRFGKDSNTLFFMTQDDTKRPYVVFERGVREYYPLQCISIISRFHVSITSLESSQEYHPHRSLIPQENQPKINARTQVPTVSSQSRIFSKTRVIVGGKRCSVLVGYVEIKMW